MVIYEIKNKIIGKSYIGYSTKFNSDKEFQKSTYWGSGFYIENVIKKYGKPNFERKVLLKDIFDFEDLKRYEILWIKKKNSKKPNGYNLTDGGDGVIGIIPWNKGKKVPNCGRKGKIHWWIPWNKGKIMTNPITLNKMREAKLNKPGNRRGIKSTQESIDQMKQTKLERKCGFKKYEFIDPLGNKFIVEGKMKIFCKEHQLRYDSIFQLLKGKVLQGHHKGWRVKRLNEI